jgi:hypothetical protein
MDETHEEGLEALHNDYHRYKLGFRSYGRKPLDYTDWLEHKAVRLADKLAETTDALESAEEDRDRYQHAAQANHDAWCEMAEQHNRLHGFVAALRHQMQMGNMAEVLRLVLHYCCWN